jgi:toxin FitB
VFITTITEAEVLYGIELLPAGKRKSQLSAIIEKLFAEDFQGRILSFDEDSARAFATRNTNDFEHCGIRVINPWTE